MSDSSLAGRYEMASRKARVSTQAYAVLLTRERAPKGGSGPLVN